MLSITALVLCPLSADGQNRDVDPRSVFEEHRPLSFASIRTSHFGRGPLDRLLESPSRWLIDVENSGGPEVIAYYTQMYQPGSQGGPDNWTINQELDAYAKWDICQSRLGTGRVYAYYYQVQDNFTRTNTQQFADAAGTVWLPNYNDADGMFSSLDMLVWEQSSSDQRFQALIGQLDPGVLVDLNHYSGDDTGYFFSEPLATNPVRAFPLAGLGLALDGELTEGVELVGIISDATADGHYPDFRSLGDGRWFYAGQLTLRPEIGGTRGWYRVMYYGIDATETEPRGRGLALSFDQPLGDAYGAFFRFSQADGRRRALRKFVNSGFVWLAPGGWEDDRAGIGFIWGQPTDRRLSDQYGLELFYRWQATARMEFSTDVQWIIDPALTNARESLAVGGMRVRWTF
ncbi:carbohydrate porin [Aeoliella sp.]|uniref:carbohydrate porin n=1 Tax=Aeoliella sp. TaxID=2795800 RepID=UPI003CCB8F7D